MIVHRWSVRVESPKKQNHTHTVFKLIAFIVCMSPSFTGVTEVKAHFVPAYSFTAVSSGKMSVGPIKSEGVCVEVCVELGGVTLSFLVEID